MKTVRIFEGKVGAGTIGKLGVPAELSGGVGSVRRVTNTIASRITAAAAPSVSGRHHWHRGLLFGEVTSQILTYLTRVQSRTSRLSPGTGDGERKAWFLNVDEQSGSVRRKRYAGEFGIIE